METLRIVFLGTGGSTPTVERSLPSIAIRRGAELILFDCGEGTQHRMVKARVGFMRKMKIFITHLHGDHILGLPGLLQTMSLLGRERKLEVYGPEGLKSFIECVMKTVKSNISFDIEVHEVGEGKVCEEPEYSIEAAWASHSVPTLAYALVEKPRPGKFHPEKALELGVPKGPLWYKLQHGQPVKLQDGRVIEPSMVVGPLRPGRKIVYSGDTRPCEGVEKLAQGADVLIHEATFSADMVERALRDGHSTSVHAAEVALRASVRRLYLFHISPRYADPSILLEEARRVFPNTWLSEDLMVVDVKPRE